MLPPFLINGNFLALNPTAPRPWIQSNLRSARFKSIHRAMNKRFKTLPPTAEQALFHHPHRAVARMVDDLAGDAAEEELFAS